MIALLLVLLVSHDSVTVNELAHPGQFEGTYRPSCLRGDMDLLLYEQLLCTSDQRHNY